MHKMQWLFRTWIGKWLLVLGLVVLSSIVLTGAAYAISFFIKNVAAIGQFNYTAEVTIVDQKALNAQTYKVKAQANESTVPDRTYAVNLYGLVGNEETLLASRNESWNSSQVLARTQKTIVFEGVNLTPYNKFWVEITH